MNEIDRLKKVAETAHMEYVLQARIGSPERYRECQRAWVRAQFAVAKAIDIQRARRGER